MYKNVLKRDYAVAEFDMAVVEEGLSITVITASGDRIKGSVIDATPEWLKLKSALGLIGFIADDLADREKFQIREVATQAGKVLNINSVFVHSSNYIFDSNSVKAGDAIHVVEGPFETMALVHKVFPHVIRYRTLGTSKSVDVKDFVTGKVKIKRITRIKRD